MSDAPTGPRFAEENRRLINKTLEEVAKAAAVPVPGSVTAEAAHRVVEVADGRSDSRLPADPRPTLRQVLSEQRFGKPTPPEPAPAPPPIEAVRVQLRERMLAISERLAVRRGEDLEAMRERDELGAQLRALEAPR